MWPLLSTARLRVLYFFSAVFRAICAENQLGLIGFQLGFFRIQHIGLRGRIDFRHQVALFNLLPQRYVQLF